MDRKKLAIISILLVIIIVTVTIFTCCIKQEKEKNHVPTIEITYPTYNKVVSKIVTISGISSDIDGDNTIQKVEVMVNNSWVKAEGTNKWSYSWEIYDLLNGYYTIKARCFDGELYSETDLIRVEIYNPTIVESDEHKWAIFISAANFPKNNESKLGNGPLDISERMADYFINYLNYPTSNIYILFDDGWIRKDNGFGKPIQTLQERVHDYDIIYEGAKKKTVVSTINQVINESNQFDDSEVFIWFSSHGCGDNSSFLGGKVFDRSELFLWDDTLTDKELGNLLSDLRSKKTSVMVDACFSGGFADKTIFNFPEFFLLKSNIPKPGRVVIAGASKFRVGFASTVSGPLFTNLWFNGILTGDADGFRPGILNNGRPTRLNLFKDGKISVEEAFYYARYTLKNEEIFEDYNKMEPQINDQFPWKGIIRNNKGLILGQ